MAQNETWLNHDLSSAVKVQYLDGNLFSMDNAGNLIGVTLTKDGVAYSGGGTVSANVIRADGGTVAVSGALSVNVATVVLPQAAYAVPGVASIIVKLTVSGEVTTIAAVVANVYESITSITIDPGTIIPSIQTLINQIDTAVASIPADYSSLWTSLAPAFSTSTAYTAGQYVTYNGGLYRFIADHAAGDWSSSDVVAVNVGDDLSEARKAFFDYAVSEFGTIDIGTTTASHYIKKSDGQANTQTSTAWEYTGYIELHEKALLFTCPEHSSDNTVNAVAAIAFYKSATTSGSSYLQDAVVSVIKGITGNSRMVVVPVPEEANYFRASILTATKANFKIVGISSWAEIPNEFRAVWDEISSIKSKQAQTFSTSISYKAGQYVTRSGNLYRFLVNHSAGSWNANQVELVDFGTGITNNYNAISDITKRIPIIYIPGKYIDLSGSTVTMTDGIPTLTGDSSAGYSVGYMACTEGDIFTVCGHGGSSTRLWGFVDSQGNILSVSAANLTEIERTVVAPQNAAFIIVHTNNSHVTEMITYKWKKTYGNRSRNLLTDFGTFTSETNNSVAFEWQQDNETCIVNGTATGGVAYNYFRQYTESMPSSIVPGKRYFVNITASEEYKVGIRFRFQHPSGSSPAYHAEKYFRNAVITVPSDCVGIGISLAVNQGVQCSNVWVKVSITEELSDNEGATNNASKMYSVGSSFMTGWIYFNNQYTSDIIHDHNCGFDDSPYGNVAIGMGIERQNVYHTLMPSTGLLYVADQSLGNCLDKLLDTDLSPYDYVLTEINRPDLGTNGNVGFPLGNLNSTADKTTIVGAVKVLLNYLKTSAKKTTLILVGAPPSATDDSFAYGNVFTAIYGNGCSIADVDIMMHRLAIQEHFIFIDWEDLQLSYYYKDLCDSDNNGNVNVHPNSDETVRVMGQYLARNNNYGTSIAKVIRADMNS